MIRRPALRTVLLLLVTLLAVPAQLLAILPGEEPKAVAPPAPKDPAVQDLLTRSAPWTDFLARHGSDWVVSWDEDSGLVQRAVSRGYRLTGEHPDRETVLSATRGFLHDGRDVFGVGDDEVEVLLAEQTTHHWVVHYRQFHQGIPVEGSQISFFVNDEGKLALIQQRRILPDPGISTLPTFPREIAEDVFLSAMLPSGPDEGVTTVLDESELVILGVGDPVRPRLAWRVGVLLEGAAHHYVGHVDASTAEILRWSDEVYHVNVVGTIDGRAHVDHPNTSVTVQSLPHIRVQVSGGNTGFTDASGSFNINHGGSSNVTVSTSLVGRYASVDNTAGTELTASGTFTPGVSSNLRVYPSGTAEFSIHQVDAYLQTTLVHDYFKMVIPNGTTIDRVMPANVNINSSCNAFWNGSSTNYYRRAGSCNNTAFASVIAHEIGHGYDSWYGGILDGGLSEGLGDILSMYLLGYPTIGPYFFTSGAGIRNGSNGRTWPASECGGEVHCVGEVWMGYAWLVRQSLINALGQSAGADAAEQAVIPIFVGNPDTIPDAVVQTFIFDDDNGDLSDGTPHFTQLAGAADIKNFNIPAPPVIDSINPTQVGRCSGTQLQVNGDFFIQQGLEVRIGGVLAEVASFNADAGTVRVFIPDLVDGTYDVTVATPFGVAIDPQSFTILDQPEVVLQNGLYVGVTTHLEVCGTPGADYFLAASLRPGNLSFEGAPLDLGSRLFILENSFSGPDAPLDGNGVARVPVPVPQNENLIFLSPLFQAAIREGASWNVTPVTRATILP